MSKVYKGYELMKAIADGEIKDRTRLEIRMNNTKIIYADAIYLNKNIRVSIAGDGTDYEDLLNFEHLLDILQSEITVIELVEDEIDIDSIEEIDIDQVINTDDKAGIALLHINKLIRAVKQLNKEIKEFSKR